jgi:SAM-dependent methyltransferase
LNTYSVFDQAHYDALNRAREDSVCRFLPELKQRLSLKTALDLGCGLGHFSELLHSFGLEVLGVDGRAENADEAKRRHPNLNFQVADAQDPNLCRLGNFDLVFCFGLFYHLENPFRAIRSISSLASKLTLIEGIVCPSPEPTMVLLDENECLDQGLNFMAFYPSESCLIKMLRRSGFLDCYMPEPMPDHPMYHVGANGFRLRTLLVGSKRPIDSSYLTSWSDPSPEIGPWAMMPLYPARRIKKVYGALDRLLRPKRS